MYLALVALVVVALVYMANKLSPNSKYKSTQFNLPNGPKKWPILGNYHQMLKDSHLVLSKWGEQYGDLFTVYFLNKPALVVNEVKLMKELFTLPASAGAFSTESFLRLSQGPYGVLSTDGKTWAEQRQFCMRSLINFGFGSATTKSMILEEIDHVNKWIEKESEKNGGQVVLNDVLMQAANNFLWSIVSGERTGLNDSKVLNLLKSFLAAMQLSWQTGLTYFPWMKYVAPNWSGYNALDKAGKDLHIFMNEQFEESKKTLVVGAPRNVLDSYLEQMRNTKDPQSTFYGKDGMLHSLSTVVELFAASGNTTSATVNWLVIYLSWYPEVQRKLVDEIDEIVGQDREPSLQDKPRMPYTDAVVQETFRLSSLVPLGLMHTLMEDVQFHGYNLPKGLVLLPNMYNCHYSKKVWGDPEQFRPERFLENPALKNNLVPFQPGKRYCIGEPLARDAFFLFIVKLFQKWHVTPKSGISKDEYFDADIGLLRMPKRHGIIFTKRIENM